MRERKALPPTKQDCELLIQHRKPLIKPDEAGRPASDAMHVEERFHRVDHGRLELTVTIDDPKMHTKPWVALNKFPMRLQSPDYDVVEMMCVPSEMEQYYKDYGDPASGVGTHASP